LGRRATISRYLEIWDASTLTVDELQTLLQNAGVTPKAGVKLENVAKILLEEFWQLRINSVRSEDDRAIRKWLDEIKMHSQALLERLDAVPLPAKLWNYDLLMGLFTPEAEASISDILRETVVFYICYISAVKDMGPAGSRQRRAVRKRVAKSPLWRLDDIELPVIHTPAAIEVTAMGLAFLAQAAETAQAAMVPPVPKSTGPRPSPAEVHFVERFCKVYRGLTGHNETLTLNGPAIRLCCDTVKFVHDRLPKIPAAGFEEGFIEFKRSLQNLSNATVVADRIRDYKHGGPRPRPGRRAKASKTQR